MNTASNPQHCTAFLLAAGYGTRLRPLTAVRPKPLLPVCGVPMLDHALAHVRAHGHTRVLVNAHHLWEQVAAWAEAEGVELQVELPEILGTGGGLRAARERLAERFVVVNADVLSDVDLTALVAACPQDGAAMALRSDPNAERIGPVEANADGRVVRITSVVPGVGGIPGTHFTGVHVLSRSALEMVPPEGLQCIVRTGYRQLVGVGRVQSISHTGAWFDIGTPAAYLEANLALLSGSLHAPVDPWTRGTTGGDGCWVGVGATLRGSATRSVIGARAVVPQGSSITECVVWDGVTVPAGEHRRAVFYGAGDVLQIGETG